MLIRCFERTILFFTGLALLSLPFSRRIELTHDASYYLGYYQEYVTPSIYVFDLCILLALVFLCGFCALRSGTIGRLVTYLRKNTIHVSLVVFFISSLFLWTSSHFTTGYYVCMWVVALLFGIICRQLFLRDAQDVLIKVFLAGLVAQVFIGLGQIVSGASIGISYLGESVIGLHVPGTAKVVFWGVDFVRPYGTLPHPNVFAIFLFIGVVLLFHQLRLGNFSQFWRIPFVILCLGILLSFSRAVWIGSLVFFGAYGVIVFFRKDGGWSVSRRFILSVVAGVIFLLPLMLMRFLYPDHSMSIELRREYMSQALSLLMLHPWGVGLGAYTLAVKSLLNGNEPGWYLQPVHNTYLLALVELGWARFILFLVIMRRFIRGVFGTLDPWLLSVVLSFSLLLFFEHAFWDLRQVVMVIALFVAYVYSERIVIK